MHEINFRAWDGEEMYIPEIQPDEEGCPINEWFSGFKNVTLMQYTNLKDKNGKKIYEGDIINHLSYLNSPDMNTEAWRVETVENLQDFFESTGYRTNELGEQFSPDYLEVIGNIYQNPELLK